MRLNGLQIALWWIFYLKLSAHDQRVTRLVSPKFASDLRVHPLDKYRFSFLFLIFLNTGVSINRIHCASQIPGPFIKITVGDHTGVKSNDEPTWSKTVNTSRYQFLASLHVREIRKLVLGIRQFYQGLEQLCENFNSNTRLRRFESKQKILYFSRFLWSGKTSYDIIILC